MGWFGRPGARDMREPDCERAWFGWALKLILERFMAEEGMGIAEILLLVTASVYAQPLC